MTLKVQGSVPFCSSVYNLVVLCLISLWENADKNPGI